MIGQIHLDSINVLSWQQSIPSCTLWALPCQVKCLVLNCCTEIYFLNICIKQPRVLNEMSYLIWHPRHEACICPQPTPTAPLCLSVSLPGRKICSILLTPWLLCLLSFLWGYRCSMCQPLPCVVQGALAKPPAFTRALGACSQECWDGCSPSSCPGAQQLGMFSKPCRDGQSICFLPPGLWSWCFPGLEALVSSFF